MSVLAFFFVPGFFESLFLYFMMPSLNQCILISKFLLGHFRKSSSGLFLKRSNKSLWKAGKAQGFRYANEPSQTVSSNDLEVLKNDCLTFCFFVEDNLFTTSSRNLTSPAFICIADNNAS